MTTTTTTISYLHTIYHDNLKQQVCLWGHVYTKNRKKYNIYYNNDDDSLILEVETVSYRSVKIHPCMH